MIGLIKKMDVSNICTLVTKSIILLTENIFIYEFLKLWCTGHRIK